MKRAYAQIHLAVLLWGFTGILGKAISLSAPVLVWYRMLITAGILAIILTNRGDWIKIIRKDLVRIIGIGVMYAIHWVAFYASIKYSNASIAMVCLATASVFTALLDPLLNKGKFNYIEIFLSFIAIAGVYCIYALQPHATNGSAGMVHFEWGVILGVIAAIISAIFTVLNKPLAEKYQPRTIVFYEMTIGLIFLSVLAPFYIYNQGETLQLLPQGWDYLWIFLLSYCCTVWGQSLAMSALKHLSAFTITLSVNLEPVYGIILAFLIYKENNQLGYGFYIGMGFIFMSLMLQILIIVFRNKAAKDLRKNKFPIQ
ncbi:DMT family transporter [Taibaiella lutea]|nr:DMT family transporter [Taibaiella lutea]